MKTLNAYLLFHIVGLLKKNHFTQITANYTANGVRSVVEDADGTKYEIHVKTIQPNTSTVEANNAVVSRLATMDFIENRQTYKLIQETEG